VPSALTGINFGCRADQPLKDKVGQLLRDRAARGLPDVTLYYATMNEATYGIDICGAATGRRARWGGRLPVS